MKLCKDGCGIIRIYGEGERICLYCPYRWCPEALRKSEEKKLEALKKLEEENKSCT